MAKRPWWLNYQPYRFTVPRWTPDDFPLTRWFLSNSLAPTQTTRPSPLGPYRRHALCLARLHDWLLEPLNYRRHHQGRYPPPLSSTLEPRFPTFFFPKDQNRGSLREIPHLSRPASLYWLPLLRQLPQSPRVLTPSFKLRKSLPSNLSTQS